MKLFKGWIGEQKTAFNMWISLNTQVYHPFHDIILPSKNGTAQIDHLLVSPYGFFIVETKNKSGWIFGSGNQKYWTQVLSNGKYTFQNPLHQTYRQKKVLSEFLNVHDYTIHTVVYFVGDCAFKTPMPENVIKYGLGTYIKNYDDVILSEEEVDEAVRALKIYLSTSTLSTRDHLRSLNQRHNSDTICPKCGSELVRRTAKTGPYTGDEFLGCSRYPMCSFRKNAPQKHNEPLEASMTTSDFSVYIFILFLVALIVWLIGIITSS